jgi:hypothetical protein
MTQSDMFRARLGAIVGLGHQLANLETRGDVKPQRPCPDFNPIENARRVKPEGRLSPS